MTIAASLSNTGKSFWNYTGQPTGVRSFKALDGLRGYMAWWVVIGHALQLCDLQKIMPEWFGYGDHAVNLFICLSGFVICHLLLEKNESYGRYITRRAFRIFPIYWFALICALVFVQAYDFVYTSDWLLDREMRLARFESTAANFPTHLALHLTMLHGSIPDTWLPFSSSSLLAPAWSLSLEWQFYLAAPFIIAGLSRPGLSRLITIIFLSAAWIAFKKLLPLTWQYPSALPLSIHFFMLGILSRVFLTKIARVGFWIIPIGFAIALIGPNSTKIELTIWTLVILATGLQLHASNENTSMKGGGAVKFIKFITSNRVACWLGEFSYSTYLIHIPIFSVVGWLIAKFSGLLWSQNLVILSTGISFLLLIPISLALYLFIEKPFIRLGSSLLKPVNFRTT